MEIEYEATFLNIDKDDIRGRLTHAGAVLLKPEFIQKRVVFHLPKGHELKGGWLRVRDEGDRITMSLKVVDGDTIQDQKETCLVVDSFELTCTLLESIGCVQKAYQETKRELWSLNGVEITIDEWPFLEPFVEVEGQDETSVRETTGKIGFDYTHAHFCHVGTLYGEKYGFDEEVFNNHTPLLTFEMENPFFK